MSWKYFIPVLFVVCSCLAQQARSSSYYPLELGNVWFYRFVGRAPSDSTIDSSVRVIGDTLWPNGYRYFVLSAADIMGSRYVRVDSNSVFYVNPYSEQDMRVFCFNGQSGDTTQISWGPFWISRLASIETVQVFSQPRRVLTFELDGIMFAELKFCKDLGPMTEWRYSDLPPQSS